MVTKMDTEQLKKIIETSFKKIEEIDPQTKGELPEAINEVINLLDKGKVRVAEKKIMNGLEDYVNNGGNFFIEMAEGLISNHNYEAKIIQLEALRYFVKNSTKSDFPVISKHLEAF